MVELSRLFQPGRIGTLEIRNRIIMPAMGTSSADAEGRPTDRMIDYYAARAKGGVGLIITTGLRVRRKAWNPGQLCGFDDGAIPRLRDLVSSVQVHGARIALQLNHRGRALAERRNPANPDDLEVVGPSAVPLVRNNVAPRELTREDIGRLVDDFGEAARRVKAAGANATEVHGAHGFLIATFLSPSTNKRTDEYGGTVEKRARFACEIVQRVRQKVGPDFPIIFRISGSEFLEGGTTIADTQRQVPLLVEAGANAFHVSASGHDTTEWQFLSYLWPDGAIVDLAAAVKKVVKVPVITVGKLSDPVLAERVIAEGKADFVAMGRGLLTDPDLPDKAKAGRLDEIRRCIYCNNCLAKPRTEKLRFGGIFCTVNPGLFREREFALKPTAAPKKVMVIGGGLAGMEAAGVLAERGHQVTLYEESDTLGGQWRIASLQKSKGAYASVIDDLKRRLEKASVRVMLNTKVTAQLVRETRPDAVVLATGALPQTLNVPTAKGQNVVNAIDLISGKAAVGDKVVVVGGRLIGMEVADMLAEQGKRVSLVTLHRLGENGKALETTIYHTLRNRLIDHGVFIYPETPVLEIVANGVHVAHNRELLFLKADTVVIAIGTKPENGLMKEIAGLVPEMHAIGDCVEPRDAMEAIREGAEIGRLV
ncbi:MAG: FAD-dependent oxidoreductase [Chloroflexi bacterium]|nr:FAD-dependent oxidoreductase [Chloroflexota bacterium]